MNIDYHVELYRHYYIALNQLVGEKVFIRARERRVEIFLKHRRVASNRPPRVRGRQTTQAKHMPPNHRYYAE